MNKWKMYYVKLLIGSLTTRNFKIWKMLKSFKWLLFCKKRHKKEKMWLYRTTFIDFRWRRNRSSNLFLGSDWVRDTISRSWTGIETLSVLLCIWERRWIRRRHLLVNLIGWLQKVHLKRISTLFLKYINLIFYIFKII